MGYRRLFHFTLVVQFILVVFGFWYYGRTGIDHKNIHLQTASRTNGRCLQILKFIINISCIVHCRWLIDKKKGGFPFAGLPLFLRVYGRCYLSRRLKQGALWAFCEVDCFGLLAEFLYNVGDFLQGQVFLFAGVLFVCHLSALLSVFMFLYSALDGLFIKFRAGKVGDRIGDTCSQMGIYF